VFQRQTVYIKKLDTDMDKTKNTAPYSRSIALEAISTRCSAIAERPRCRVRYSFRQKWKTGTGRHYFTDITCLSKTVEFGEKTAK